MKEITNKQLGHWVLNSDFVSIASAFAELRAERDAAMDHLRALQDDWKRFEGTCNPTPKKETDTVSADSEDRWSRLVRERDTALERERRLQNMVANYLVTSKKIEEWIAELFDHFGLDQDRSPRLSELRSVIAEAERQRAMEKP